MQNSRRKQSRRPSPALATARSADLRRPLDLTKHPRFALGTGNRPPTGSRAPNSREPGFPDRERKTVNPKKKGEHFRIPRRCRTPAVIYPAIVIFSLSAVAFSIGGTPPKIASSTLTIPHDFATIIHISGARSRRARFHSLRIISSVG